MSRILECKKTGAEKEALGLQKVAIDTMSKEIRSSTSSMTSVPKPLKFLSPHYAPLQEYYEALADEQENKPFLADVLSILAMTMGKEGSRQSLAFKLKGSKEPLGDWGHEYVRNISGEIGQEYAARTEKDVDADVADLLALVTEIVPFNIKHNAEYEAIDLLVEVEQLEQASSVVTADNFERAAKYLLAVSEYIGDPDEQMKIWQLSYDAYFSNDALADALRVAIRMDNTDKMVACFNATEDELMQKQLAFICGSHRIILEEFEDDDDLMEVMGNVHLSQHFMQLAGELDVKDAKTPEDIYKTHLVDGKTARRTATTGPSVDSAKQNLASSFVNAFVNCGFGNDLLVTPDGSDWLYKNKAHGMMSAAASLGMILLWDVETGFSTVDKYSFSTQSMIKAGSLLATGMLSSGVTSEMDAALALLSEYIEDDKAEMRTAAVLGLGQAYAGSNREDVLEILVPLIVDDTQSMELVSLTCLALGMVFVGSANDDISGSILEAFLDRSETDLNDSSARLMCLGMGLLYLGQGEKIESAVLACKAVEHPIQKYLELTITTCGYFGSCSVLEVQKLLSVISEQIEDDEKEPMKGMHQEVAVLGIAMLAMGENLGAAMALRSLDHILQCSQVNVRRAVPLALGLLSISNPQLTIMDTLSKLSHDQDEQVSQNAVLSLGLLGAGTNNSRIATVLRDLSGYYAKEPNHLFLVRIAQGLLHMGKGLMTLNPFHSDNFLMSKVGVAGILAVLHSSLDLKNSVLSKRHYILYTLVCAVRPRMLICLDEELNQIPVSVRVGTKVDTTGQAGKPKTLTGFQTHTTPVLLAAGEKAELNTKEYIPLSNVLEGFVICKRNEKYKPEEEE